MGGKAALVLLWSTLAVLVIASAVLYVYGSPWSQLIPWVAFFVGLAAGEFDSIERRSVEPVLD